MVSFREAGFSSFEILRALKLGRDSGLLHAVEFLLSVAFNDGSSLPSKACKSPLSRCGVEEFVLCTGLVPGFSIWIPSPVSAPKGEGCLSSPPACLDFPPGGRELDSDLCYATVNLR